MSTMVQDIRSLHIYHRMTSKDIPWGDLEELHFRIMAMQEELEEFTQANTQAEQLDALIDLVVFAMGTAERMGLLPAWDNAWSQVLQANMAKVRGPNAKRGDFQVDLQKPPGWKPPDIQAAIDRLYPSRSKEERHEDS
ncbi:MAG: HAD family hydrolase [Candidatus Poribacteria bacterium]|nr:HAD family hydrolase [Candidatus Poribacteria bacterium]